VWNKELKSAAVGYAYKINYQARQKHKIKSFLVE